MMFSIGRVLLLMVFVLVLRPGAQESPKRPVGIYAIVNVNEYTKKEQAANASISSDELRTYFANLYRDLLNNPAVSGVAIWVDWSKLNPNPPTSGNAYDWAILDDAFAAASSWNTQHPSDAPKTIQLVPLPGFNSPQWLLDRLASCDGLLQTPAQTPTRACGKVTVSGFVEGRGVRQLPLPWNVTYKNAWHDFLSALAARYGSNQAFVSISVAGPTASSEEMILPDNANTPAQDQFHGLSANAMWLKLLAFHFPGKKLDQRSDQVFVDEWKAAIDMYASVFSGVTLVATTGGGLPNLAAKGFTVPEAFTTDCPHADMDCAAETTILSYFAQPSVGGSNAKAVQEDGMEAARLSLGRFNLGVDGIKLVSRTTAQLPAPSAQILGGAQFNSSFSNFPLVEGCPSKFPPKAKDRPSGCTIPPSCTTQNCIRVECIPQTCLAPGVTPADIASYQTLGNVPKSDLVSPEQAAYNVLKIYFNNTPVAEFFGGTRGDTPFNYLQIYGADFQYADAHRDVTAKVVEAGGKTTSVSAQDLLNLASRKLLEIVEPSSLRVSSK